MHFQEDYANVKKYVLRYVLQKAKKQSPENAVFWGFLGVPDTIRTCDLQSRSLTLYPAELRAHGALLIITQVFPGCKCSLRKTFRTDPPEKPEPQNRPASGRAGSVMRRDAHPGARA